MTRSTIKQIRECLDYNPRTGIFIWKTGRFTGKIAGCLYDDGYIVIRIGGTPYPAGRLAWAIMKGRWPRNDIDHKNRDRGDNRFKNLREATRSQNKMNQKQIGVSWCIRNRKWVSRIMVKGKRRHLGLYDSYKEALAVRRKVARNLQGEFYPV